MDWKRTGDLICAERFGMKFEITREEMEHGLPEWILRIDGDYDETFHRLKDAKHRADCLRAHTNVSEAR